MLNGWVHEGDGGAFCFAGQLKGEDKPRSCHFYLQQPDPFAHFAYQVQAIESMIQTGHAAVPGRADAADDRHPRRGHDQPARGRQADRDAAPDDRATSRPTGRSPTDPIPKPIKR